MKRYVVAGAGIEPADTSFKATDFYQQKLPRSVLLSRPDFILPHRSASGLAPMRESNPPVQVGSLAPLPLGQGHLLL